MFHGYHSYVASDEEKDRDTDGAPIFDDLTCALGDQALSRYGLFVDDWLIRPPLVPFPARSASFPFRLVKRQGKGNEKRTKRERGRNSAGN